MGVQIPTSANTPPRIRLSKTGESKNEGGWQGCHLEVKDSGVSLAEALPVGDHPVEDVVVQRERGDGRQQPAVPCEHTPRGP